MNDSINPPHYKQLPLFPEKPCTKCGKSYPLTLEFWHKSKHGRYGLTTYCRTCERERSLAYKTKHRKEACERQQRYYKENKERYAAWRKANPTNVKEWIEANPDRKKAIVKRYLTTHRERLNEKTREYQRLNPEKMNVRPRRRRARKLNAEGSHTADEIKALYTAQNGQCFHCGFDLSTGYHADHWIPLARGGSNYISNIRLLCPFCNQSKGSKLPHEWSSRYAEDKHE